MRRIVVLDSLKVTVIVSAVIITCSILADFTSQPVQLALGVNGEQIRESQNLVFFSNHLGFVFFSIFGTFGLSCCMLSYLEHGK